MFVFSVSLVPLRPFAQFWRRVSGHRAGTAEKYLRLFRDPQGHDSTVESTVSAAQPIGARP